MRRLRHAGGGLLMAWLSVCSLGAAAGSVQLVEAVKKADKASIAALLRERIDVNTPDFDGATALHWAVEQDDHATAALLIRSGANVKAANRYGVTPLSLACTNGNAAVIEMLLTAGADPNTALPEGETALMTAARTGKADAVKALLAHGANVNAKEQWKGQTALMWAAAEGHAAAIQALVEGGADIRIRSTRGFTPFLFAARDGRTDAVKALLKLGANVNEMLPPEARGGASANADASPAPPKGTTALLLAVMNAHYELAGVLLDAGADPNADGTGYTALHQIAITRRPGNGANFPGPVGSGELDSLDLVRKLVAHGAKVNARMTKEPRDGPQSFQSFLNWIDATPFLLAARAADAPLMRRLAEVGADPLLPNEDNTPPLTVAAGVGVRSPGEEPGTEAEILAAVKVALELGGDVNAVDKNGDTVMHGAAVRGLNSLVQLLADSGARVEVWNQKNNRGYTPLNLAEGAQRKNLSFQSSPQLVPLFRQLLGGEKSASNALAK